MNILIIVVITNTIYYLNLTSDFNEGIDRKGHLGINGGNGSTGDI
jgi:hypothetical protein